MVLELMGGIAIGFGWDMWREKKAEGKLRETLAEFDARSEAQWVDRIRSMNKSDIINYLEAMDLDIGDEVMEWVNEHHEDLGLQDMSYDELQRLVDNSEWEDLVGGDLGDDIPHWYGTHIPDTEQFEASREHLIDFHKYAYYWRLMNDENEY